MRIPKSLFWSHLFVVLVTLVGCRSAPSASVAAAHDHYRRGDFQSAEQAASDELQGAPMTRSMWHVKINAAIRAGEHARGVQTYLEWHKQRRHYDTPAIRAMAVSSLWHALSADARPSQLAALRTLRRHKVPELAADIARRMGDADPLVAGLAASLAGDARGRQRVAELLASAPPRVRAQLIAALPGAYRGGLSDQVLAGLRDGAAEVRKSAARTIGRWGLKRGASDLAQLVARDPDGAVRAAALQALTRPAIQSAIQSGPLFVARVARERLRDSYLGARLAALAVLVSQPGKHRAELFEAASDSDSFLALRAAVALRKSGHEPPIRTLQLALSHRQWSVRAAALNAVNQLLPARDALTLIEDRLADPRIEVRLAAARALANLGYKSRARAVFVAALSADREPPRVQAAVDLLRMKDDLGRDALARLATSRSPETRQMAVEAHAFTVEPTLPLIRALGDSVPTVRIAAAATLLGLM